MREKTGRGGRSVEKHVDSTSENSSSLCFARAPRRRCCMRRRHRNRLVRLARNERNVFLGCGRSHRNHHVDVDEHFAHIDHHHGACSRQRSGRRALHGQEARLRGRLDLRGGHLRRGRGLCSGRDLRSGASLRVRQAHLCVRGTRTWFGGGSPREGVHEGRGDALQQRQLQQRRQVQRSGRGRRRLHRGHQQRHLLESAGIVPWLGLEDLAHVWHHRRWLRVSVRSRLAEPRLLQGGLLPLSEAGRSAARTRDAHRDRRTRVFRPGMFRVAAP